MVRLHVALIATLLFIAGTVPAQAQSVPPKTVRDCFLLLPQKYFDIPLAQRKSWLSHYGNVIDTAHDYLKFVGDGAQATITVALFRHHGSVLVAVHYDAEDGSLDFLRYAHGHWKDVTRRVVPVRMDGDHQYELPRYGTTIRVTYNKFNYETLERAHPAGRHVYDLVWVNGGFVVRRPARHT